MPPKCHPRPAGTPWTRPTGAVCAAALLSAAASAPGLDFDVGGVGVRFDTTLSQGFTFRVAEPDSRTIGVANGGRAFSVNHDDATLNYAERDIVQNVSKFTSDLEVDAGWLSGFARFNGFLDWENRNGSRERTALSDAAVDHVGDDLDVLDAFATAQFELGPALGQVRFGKQVISWGESTFIPNGINVINPVDVRRLRTPGAELREALTPLETVYASVSPTFSTSIEGFYQLNWRKVELDPPGFYFSTSDIVGPGADKAVLGFGAFSDLGTGFGALTPAINADLAAGGLAAQPAFDPDFLGVPRAPDRNPDNEGQFGVALRYFSERLNDTEFGLYFMNFHSRLPIVSARTGTAAGVAAGNTAAACVAGSPACPGSGATAGAVGAATAASLGGAIGADRYARTANYFLEYPRNIKLYGLSFNTELGTTGWALQGEYSYKEDVPLQIDDVELLFAALSPLGFGAFDVNQVGVFGTDTIIPGFIERDMSQIQVTATKVLGPTLGADQAAFVAEVGLQHVHDMPDKSVLRLNADGTDTSGNSFHAGPTGGHAGRPAESFEDFPDATSWGYRLAASLTYLNALGPVNLTPRLQFQHDVSGIAPQPFGVFREDRMALSVGVKATYLETWEFDAAYTEFFGAGRHNLLNDRDFVSATLKYSF